ncbi:copper amine oxidase N-terminal domain-containing protein [Paenibacillus sp. GCM10027627]|uniref:copper amine oxidase N-terminal domain-containing protein n=1 Tax=unclassified Paenibacillus TaxID=185978 RepID=UPI00363257FC
MTRKTGWTKVVLAAALLILTLPSFQEEVSAKAKPVSVTINGDSHNSLPFKNEPLLQNGTVYLPLREVGTVMKTSTTWVAEGKRILLNSPTVQIEMKLGTKQSTVNGKPYTLKEVPQNIKGVVYVPARFVTEKLGAQVDWIAKERRVHLTFAEKYVFTEKAGQAYWVERKNGKLFKASNGAPAKLLGDTKAEVLDLGELTVEALSPNVEVVKVYDNYGEPHIHTNIFKIVLSSNKVTLETKVYFGNHGARSIDLSAGKNALLMDGSTLYEIDRKGAVAAKHDLKKLTGYDDTSFQVEWYDDEYMVVRPHLTGWLTLVNRKTLKSTNLAETLLEKKDWEIYQSLDKQSIEFRDWDGLKVIGREGDILKVNYSFFLNNKHIELKYELKK